MDVHIVNFPETKVAALEYRGPPAQTHESILKLVAWRLENQLPIDRHAVTAFITMTRAQHRRQTIESIFAYLWSMPFCLTPTPLRARRSSLLSSVSIFFVPPAF